MPLLDDRRRSSCKLMASLLYPYYPFCQQKRFTSNTRIHCCAYENPARQTDTLNIKLTNQNGSFGDDKSPLVRTADAGTGNGTVPPPRPRRIILVRHGESEGNVDESIYTRVADPKIGLTNKGKAQAEETGKKMKDMIEKNSCHDWKLYFYVSPYRRALQTLQCLARPFQRSHIAGLREEPRLREQDFGNFQNREKMRVEKTMRSLYGRFFYRFPDGESAADVYDRITGFRETLRTDINIGRFQPPAEQNTEMNLVIVSHGLTLRVFLMRWYKWNVQQFEGLHNMGNGNMLVMERGFGGRYSLLMHHPEKELRDFGLTDEMLIDQEWHRVARPADLNYDCPMVNSFFPHLRQDTGRG